MFVRLARGSDVEWWERAWQRDEVTGINDCRPYGYYCAAAEFGVGVIRSHDAVDGPLTKLMRYVPRAFWDLILCMPGVAARRWCEPGAIWTNTGMKFLSVTLLLALRR